MKRGLIAAVLGLVLAAQPVFESGAVSTDADPLSMGGGCGPVRCLQQLDFIDVMIARDGTAWAAFVDGCDGEACVGSGVGIAGRMTGGPPLAGTPGDQRPPIAAPPAGKRCTPARRISLRVKRPTRGVVRSVRVLIVTRTNTGRRFTARRTYTVC